MNYVRLLFGAVSLKIKSLASLGWFSFKLPIKCEKNVTVHRRIKGRIILGKHVSLNKNSSINVTENALLKIGDYSGIGNNTIIVAREKIEIGNNVLIGPNVCIYDHDHNFNGSGLIRSKGYETSSITIEDNVWIAAGAIILKGVRIGSGSVIGAGTLVNKNIPSNSVVFNERELHIKPRQ